MKTIVVRITVLVFFILIFATVGMTQDAVKFKYVGVGKCRLCHNSTKKGSQYKVWKSSKHANAYATLATPAAQKIAKERGIEDAQTSAACLTCHLTGADAPKEQFAASFKIDKEGVGCEACHGPGSEYKSMKKMKAIHENKIDPATVGFITYTLEDCRSCHNPKSPFYKEFKPEEFWAKIAHMMPAK